jgi:hypothetical protein
MPAKNALDHIMESCRVIGFDMTEGPKAADVRYLARAVVVIAALLDGMIESHNTLTKRLQRHLEDVLTGKDRP